MMEAVSTSPVRLSMLRKFNTWYTVADGNWSNPNTWMSNGKRINSLPQPGDDVYIDHNIGLDVYHTTVNNLYVNGQLWHSLANVTLTVNGNLQAKGMVDLSQVSNANLILNGFYNFINSFEAGSSSTVTYSRPGDQDVMSLPYQNLKIYNIGIKYLTANTVINGNLYVNDFQGYDAFLECGPFDLTVYGTSSFTAKGFGGNGNFGKSGSGNLVFVGDLTIDANTTFSGNISNLEFRGGFSGGGFGGNIIVNCPVSFTTNSQIINVSSLYFNAQVLISGPITITYTNTGGVYFSGGLNGDNANSTFNNAGLINIGFTSEAMSTGIFNYMNGANSTIGYVMDTAFTLPYTIYNNLTIMQTGLKTLSGDTIINGNLAINNFYSYKARLDCSIYNLTIYGSTTVQGTGTGDTLDAGLIKSGPGKILFIGSAIWETANIGYSSNVTLEFRNGCSMGPFGQSSGTIEATINFTTNSQTFGGQNQIINGNINISDGIIVDIIGGNASSSGGQIVYGVINGSSTADTLKVTGAIQYGNQTAPMLVGILDTNSALNTFSYFSNNNQDVLGGTYRNLTLSMASGNGNTVKTLLGNVSVVDNYTLGYDTTLNINGFAFTNP